MNSLPLSESIPRKGNGRRCRTRQMLKEYDWSSLVFLIGIFILVEAVNSTGVLRVFTLNDQKARDVMVPREEMTVVPVDASVSHVARTILKSGHTRLPVTRGDGMEVVGFLHAKDMLSLLGRKEPASLQGLIRPPYFIPDDKAIDAQLRSFRARRLHQAVVLDAEGEVVGLITLEDILEELVGSIRDEHDVG